jgi:hypothetical protein
MTEKAIKTPKFNGTGWGYTVTWDSKARPRVKRVKTRTYRWQLDPESPVYKEVYGNGRAPKGKSPTKRNSSR